MAISGIWNQAMANNQSVAHAQTTTGSSNSQTSTDTAGISANDFLTLLVTEMKNQDPTSQTDPNEYINQLVQVNSLEQLISINQTLTGAFDPSSTGTSTTTQATTSTGIAQSTGAPRATAQTVNSNGAAGAIANIASAFQGGGSNGLSALGNHAAQVTNGNLGTPATSASALRVAQALSGR